MGKSQFAPEVNEKVKKNLIWIFIFTVIMLFAGLTSGYIVTAGSNFWVKINMPTAFIISTVVIFISSGCLLLARQAVKQDKLKLVKLWLGLAFIFGIAFGYYQSVGWRQLLASGNSLSGDIININGKYGKYFTLTYQDKEITYTDHSFYWQGSEVSEDLKTKMMNFADAIMAGAKSEGYQYKFENYGSEFMIKSEGTVLTYVNGKLQLDGKDLYPEDHTRLWYFGENIKNERGDFIMKGVYGEDFEIFYKGTPIIYENRQFFMDGKRLSPKLMNDLESSRNTASSYIFAFTIVHLLHWIGGIISLLVMFIKGLRTKYTSNDFLGIKIGSIYWHFLGILWLYLYLFLILIH